jgi:putative transcriptional regulator
MRKRRELAQRNNVALVNHLKQHRARMDLTQEELAELVGVRRQTILAIEKGHYVPSTLLALLLATELEMNVDELFELAREEAAPQ